MIKKNIIEVDNESLSPREIEITNLLAEGLRNKEIASKLYVSEGTIKKHIYNMCQKWAVHNRIELIKKATDLGYLGT
jgi:DNA-binding NarL/FixJ family response regulator